MEAIKTALSSIFSPREEEGDQPEADYQFEISFQPGTSNSQRPVLGVLMTPVPRPGRMGPPPKPPPTTSVLIFGVMATPYREDGLITISTPARILGNSKVKPMVTEVSLELEGVDWKGIPDFGGMTFEQGDTRYSIPRWWGEGWKTVPLAGVGGGKKSYPSSHSAALTETRWYVSREEYEVLEKFLRPPPSAHAAYQPLEYVPPIKV